MLHLKRKILRIRAIPYFICWGLLILWCSACSPYSTGPVSRVYHNLTARDNAYFLSRLKMKEAEQTLFTNRQDDYNQILPIFIPIDTVKTASVKSLIDDCVKKASLVIDRHRNSNWVDDSYVIIGKARLYQGDFSSAVETFKYVNTRGEDPNAQHDALTWLLRTFIEANEYANAAAVADYIRNQPLSKENKRKFYLTKAYLHQRRKEYKIMAGILELTVPLMRKGEEKARTEFILGQVYQLLNKKKEAHQSYRLVLKNNPPYELAFYARLNMLQVVDTEKKDNIKKAKAYFAKLLRDAKNIDYKDKIYYEMALFELGQKNYPQAIDYLKSSVKSESKNPIQKAYSFHKLALIHYEQLQKYELAKAYYDSTLANLPKEAPEYAAIEQRQKVLDSFVEQLSIIQTEDSLQQLAKMDTASLSKYFDEVLDREEAAQKIREKQQRSEDGNDTENYFATAITNQGEIKSGNEKWYMYNPTALSKGRSDFIRKFGNRPLEDNWRRAKKESSNDFAEANDTTGAQQAAVKVDKAVQRKQQKEALFKNVPSSPEQLQASNKSLEDAYYNLGKIYDLQLSEPEHAISTFDTLMTRFPGTAYEAEVFYFLYLIYDKLQDEKRNEYERKIMDKYPTSSYARLIGRSGSQEEDNESDNRAKDAYLQAYELYESGNYEQALAQVNQAMASYPKTTVEEKFVLLKAFITGKTQGLDAYKRALNEFIQTYPTSKSLPQVQELLKASEGLTSSK